MAIGSLPTALGCVVALYDGVAAARSWFPAGRRLVPIVSALLIGTLVVREVYLREHWKTLTPLRLPGARRIRMEAIDVARYRWLARTLRERTDTFVFAEHARDSFYFWTGRPPPTSRNPTFWPFMLGHADQQRVIDALVAAGRVGVVHESPGAALPDDSPLAAYLAAHFRPALTDGHFHVWLAKESRVRQGSG